MIVVRLSINIRGDSHIRLDLLKAIVATAPLRIEPSLITRPSCGWLAFLFFFRSFVGLVPCVHHFPLYAARGDSSAELALHFAMLISLVFLDSKLGFVETYFTSSNLVFLYLDIMIGSAARLACKSASFHILRSSFCYG